METSTDTKSDAEQPVVLLYATPRKAPWSFFDYFWFVLKNVVGWIFILGSLPVGLALPGPGGVPLFLLGFALVSFPGKRKITSHVMRGRPVQVDPGLFTMISTVASIAVTAFVIWLLVDRYKQILAQWRLTFLGIFGICALAAAVTWLVMRLTVWIVNWMLRNMPRVRRMVRPWLRKYGINLLPPRRKRHHDKLVEHDPDEILRFSEKYRARLNASWVFLQPWLKRVLGLTITVMIFIWMLKPVNDWKLVRDHILGTNRWLFVAAAMMFAIFLFAFRAMVWWRILLGLGHRLPIAPTVRVWSTSELARYVPGSVLQFVGRVYLIKPYGVGGSVCSTSQILELTIFLLANILVAVSCLFYFGWRNLEGTARMWLFIVAALIPLLLLILNPKFFYPVINRILAKIGKQSIGTKLRRRNLTALASWTILGLLWQSLAVWLITQDLIHLPIQKWWVVAGSYCLAWCVGFLAFWAPGGIGVREFIFVTAMSVALPDTVRTQLPDAPGALTGILAVLAILLRLWTIAGELLVASTAYLADFRGATGDPTAPGRKHAISPTPSEVAT